jgi:hypothetical protein
MSNQKKVLLVSLLSWVVSIKIFLLVSFRGEFWNIWKYSDSVFDFYKSVFVFMTDFVELISPTTAILSTLFVVLLFYFYYTYFWVSYNKLDVNVKIKNKKHAVLGGVFTFLGFGCVACGQTLLYSFLLLLGSTVSTVLAPITLALAKNGRKLALANKATKTKTVKETK